ncbi:deoxyribodipyrimidine photo-lyase [Rhodoluna sp.]|uniref:cryptochrome/photolyase family protein n=1 Tax=Rhodoluna sp. TaxID=1969481 RepID=UPI0025F0862B|nr:deoxyribodipyrimidine photo-lyase [Rhodoluna sp.]
MARVFWFRRDLRLQDNVALNSAIVAAKQDGDAVVVPFYGVEIEDFNKLSGIRQWSLIASLDALGASVDRKLTIQHGDLAQSLITVAKAAGASTVHATRAFDPSGVSEQNRVGLALKAAGIHMQLDDSYYAVPPGTIAKGDGTPYKVYTPFFRAWFENGWQSPVQLEPGVKWVEPVACHGRPIATKSAPFRVRAGEDFALRTFERFKSRALFNYDELRNRADLSGTSHLSHALAFGEIHPRTILQDLADSGGHNVFRKEIAWREFYADVLWQNPDSLTEYYEPKFARMRYDTGATAEAKLAAWQQGKTGFPMVDAGMRQLLADGWMHNRVRMIVASFLVKDLHLEWQQGAAWFEEHLSDFDPASNAHGWQWTAGSGTDASPYYRVFNPVLQGYKFDPDGNYVRKYVPELAHIAGKDVHEPWNLIDGLAHGYPAPIVDHKTERDEALRRLDELKTN